MYREQCAGALAPENCRSRRRDMDPARLKDGQQEAENCHSLPCLLLHLQRAAAPEAVAAQGYADLARPGLAILQAGVLPSV